MTSLKYKNNPTLGSRAFTLRWVFAEYFIRPWKNQHLVRFKSAPLPDKPECKYIAPALVLVGIDIIKLSTTFGYLSFVYLT